MNKNFNFGEYNKRQQLTIIGAMLEGTDPTNYIRNTAEIETIKALVEYIKHPINENAIHRVMSLLDESLNMNMAVTAIFKNLMHKVVIDNLDMLLSGNLSPKRIVLLVTALVKGFDITIVLNREYSDDQMSFIVKAMENGLNYELLLNPNIYSDSMESLLKLMLMGFDIELLVNPTISPSVIHKILQMEEEDNYF